ncbi:MAG: TAXI family TRAP transporter solute-binding subunit, partial [Alphaproteobacteria bacterium]
MHRRLFPLLLGILCNVGLTTPGVAQQTDNPIVRINGGTVGIISGGVDGTYIRIASDLADVLDDGDKLRVLAIRGRGSVQNILDILYLRGIDIGIVQSDVLEFAKRERIHPSISNLIHYVTKLYNEEIHLLARKEVGSVKDLAGKKVNFGIHGSGTEMTSSIIFDALNIDVEQTSFDQALALEKLKSGEIAALVYVAGKPTRLFRDLTVGDEVHFLPIEFTPALLDTYLPSKLTGEDYPELISPGSEVGTLAVGAVMAVYNWHPETERFGKVARFIDAFFNRFDEFEEPPRHEKWREVSLTATVPGWTRFGPATRWLAAHARTPDPTLKATFEEFVTRRTPQSASLTEEA